MKKLLGDQLRTAVSNGNRKIVGFLSEINVDPNGAKDFYENRLDTAMKRAAKLDYADITKIMLGFKKPFEAYYHDESETGSLMIAVKENNTATAKVLIEAGVSLTNKDD